MTCGEQSKVQQSGVGIIPRQLSKDPVCACAHTHLPKRASLVTADSYLHFGSIGKFAVLCKSVLQTVTPLYVPLRHFPVNLYHCSEVTIRNLNIL